MGNYKLENADETNILLLKKIKIATIINDNNISKKEQNKIIKYVDNNINNNFKQYKLIKYSNKIIGVLYIHDYKDGILLDEIYINEEYRNKGIATDIIKNMMDKKIYLWVYKTNTTALNLYKKLEFKIILESENRYLMEFDNINNIMKKMNKIKYGFIDKNKNIYQDYENWDNSFSLKYHLQSPQELLKNEYGVCWDQVELERYLFEKQNIKVKTYFIISYDEKIYPTHTFLTYELNNKYYWFEHSWEPYRGVKEYQNEKELIDDVENKFNNMLKNKKIKNNIYIYEYSKPEYGINSNQFIKYCEKNKLIKGNKLFN